MTTGRPPRAAPTLTSERRRRVHRLLGLAAIILAAFVAGFVAGGWSARAPVLARAPQASSEVGPLGPAPAGPIGDAALDLVAALDAEAWALALRSAARAATLEGLLEELRERDSSPEALVDAAIARLSDEQIRAVVGRAVQLEPESLDAIDDWPAYARRLVGIAMEGIVAPPGDPGAPGGPVAETVFSTTMDRDEPASAAAHSFEAETLRIYAAFPLGEHGGEPVLVKWIRIDRPQILLFRHYSTRADERWGFVWKERVDEWSPGEYRVDVFAGDESLRPISSGRFAIR